MADVPSASMLELCPSAPGAQTLGTADSPWGGIFVPWMNVGGRVMTAGNVASTDAATEENAGLMTADDKKKLNAAALATDIRRLLKANTTFYVRQEGSDANDGLAAATAFATLERAKSELLRIDGNGYQVTINIGPGTWTIAGSNQFGLAHTLGLSRLTYSGESPTTTILSGAAGATLFYLFGTSVPVYLQNLRFEGGANHVRADGWANCYLAGNIVFGQCSSGHITAYNSSVNITGNYSIDGNAGSQHIFMSSGSQLSCQGRTITIINTPSLVTFINVTRGSYARISGNTFNGDATGRRFTVGPLSVMETGTGGDVKHFPGTIDGTISPYGAFYS